MKVKSILVSMFALAALASCNNDENLPTGDGSSAKMSFKLSYENPTRAIQDPGSTGDITISKLTLTMLDASGSQVDSRVLSASEIADAKTANGVILEGVKTTAEKVQVVANGNNSGTAIQDYQVEFAEVPLFGEGNIDKTGSATNPADGHVLYNAAVTITPVVARFEISGAIQVDKTINGVYAVDVEQIYVNNYKHTKGTNDLTFNPHSTGAAWDVIYSTANSNDIKFTDVITTTSSPASGSFYTGTPTADHNLGVVTGKAAAYHLFAAKAENTTTPKVEEALPHVILKVKVYKDEADYTAKTPMAGYDFMTIRSFNEGANILSEIVAAKIYKIDLNSLTVNFKPNPTDPDKPIVPVDPDPEMDKFDLKVNVTVTNWSETTITPNI